jgi:hypothetical protein
LSCRNGCVNLSRQTQQSHVYAAGITIAHRIGSAWKIGAYQLHLLAQKYSWSHINQVARALRFFYRITLGHKEAFERIVTAGVRCIERAEQICPPRRFELDPRCAARHR